MPEATITNFAQGELSPLYYGRIDAQYYASAAAKIRNFIITSSGSLNKRPGTKYSGTHRYAEIDVRKFPVTVGIQQYLVEVGDNYLRFHKDGDVIMDGASPFEIVSPWSEAMLEELSWVEVDDSIIVVHHDVEPQIIKNDGTDTGWSIESFDWYSRDAAEIDPPAINSATELQGYEYISYSKFSFREGDVGQYLYIKTDTGKVGYFHIEDFISSKFVAKTVMNEDGSETTREVDVEQPDNKATGTYTAITGDPIADTDTITYFAVQPFAYMTTLRPGSVATVDSRLIFANFPDNPRKIMGSVVGQPYEFRMGSRPDLAYEFTIKDTYGTKIEWISGERSFVVGTNDGIFTIGQNEVITPTTAFRLVRQTADKCYGQKPVMAGDFMIFIKQPGTEIKILQYNYETDKYISPSLTKKSEHLFRDGIKQIAYQQSPFSVVYAVTQNGDLCAFTLDQESGVAGWTQFETDGIINDIAVVPGADGEDDVYISVRRISNGIYYYHMEKLEYYRMDIFNNAWYVDSGVELIGDEIGCSNLTDSGVITFDAAGMSVGDVIYFSDDPAGCNGLAGGYYTLATENSSTEFILHDSGGNALSGIGNSTASFIVQDTSDTISLPDAYEDGAEISVFTERGAYSGVIVSGGSVTIPNHCRIIRAGYPFTARLETLPVPIRIKDVKNIYEVGLSFFESHAGALMNIYGDVSSNISMDDDIVLDQGADLWTGVKRLQFYNGQDKGGKIVLESSTPTPMNIMAITYTIGEQ